MLIVALGRLAGQTNPTVRHLLLTNMQIVHAAALCSAQILSQGIACPCPAREYCHFCPMLHTSCANLSSSSSCCAVRWTLAIKCSHKSIPFRFFHCMSFRYEHSVVSDSLILTPFELGHHSILTILLGYEHFWSSHNPIPSRPSLRRARVWAGLIPLPLDSSWPVLL